MLRQLISESAVIPQKGKKMLLDPNMNDIYLIQRAFISPFMREVVGDIIDGEIENSNQMISLKIGLLSGLIVAIVLFFFLIWRPFLSETRERVL